MKVAVVTRYPCDPELPRGGVEAVSVNLVRALARQQGVEVHVVTTGDAAGVRRETLDGASVHRLPRRGRHVLTEAIGPGRRQMHAYLRGLAPDVVHAHDVYGLMVQGLPIPRVFTVHGFIHADTRVGGGALALPRSWLWRRVEEAGWRDQPHIVSISPYVRQRLAGIVAGEIHDIENPVGEAFFGIERRPGRPAVFCAALIEPRKNTLGLVEAFARVAAQGLDAELRLAGGIADAAYGRALERQIAALGLGERVALLGPVSSARVREELARASVFALVSLEENSPMGIEEAMAAGVPVVASNRCGMPYLVDDGDSGFLVDPGDAGEVARRLALLLGDDELRERMGRRARETARRRFHPEPIARRTLEVYRRAVAGPAGGPVAPRA